MAFNPDRAVYNCTVRNIARAHSMHFGVDTDRARNMQAQWIRRIRREYPFSQFLVTWGVRNYV
mgnify:CR=1 FL=1